MFLNVITGTQHSCNDTPPWTKWLPPPCFWKRIASNGVNPTNPFAYFSIEIRMRDSDWQALFARRYRLPLSRTFPETRLVLTFSLSVRGSWAYKKPWSAVMRIFEPLIELTIRRTKFLSSSSASAQASKTWCSVFALSPTASMVLW